MGKIRKIGKKVWRGIKKLGKRIGKAFKSVFKGVGKFLGKLGPIGTFALMIAMPYLGSYIWGGFSSWAGGMSGTFGKIMQGIVKVGDAAIGAYNTITDAIYGTIKKIPGVGDALEGFDRWLDRTRSAMGMEPGSISVMNEKELNTWAGTDAGAQAMGFENASAFKTANPTFFGADGKLTNTGLNFTRGKGMAYEAHLRGRDVFKKVDGEFDFNTYSDNFKNNVLDTDEINGSETKYVCNGSAGARGPAGQTGPAGPAGPPSSPTPAGPVGPVGPAGPAGPAAPAGPAEPAEPAGPAGPAAPVAPDGPVGPMLPA